MACAGRRQALLLVCDLHQLRRRWTRRRCATSASSFELPDYNSRKNKRQRLRLRADEQATATYTGMGDDINVHDQWAVESQGPIQDRTSEHLGTTDKGIMQYRRMLRHAIEGRRRREADHVARRRAGAPHPGPATIDGIGPTRGWETTGRKPTSSAAAARHGRRRCRGDRRQDPASVGGGVIDLELVTSSMGGAVERSHRERGARAKTREAGAWTLARKRGESSCGWLLASKE